MSTVVSRNKRIAKNTVYMYLRLLVTIAVSIYTSRVILEVLGVEDFGLYNLVWGIVLLFSFLNNAMSSACQRFLSYELGSSEGRFTNVFGTCVTIHFGICLLVLCLGETAGLWFVRHQLVVVPERQEAVEWAYQAALFTLCFNILRIPYNAAIIAYERMSFYAYTSIVEAILKLLVVYLLLWGDFDRLVLYSCLLTLVAFSLYGYYVAYCRVKLDGCRFRFSWNKAVYRRIFSYSGWTLLSSSANLATQQGCVVLVNNFFGAVVNAAYAIAHQVYAAMSNFVGSFNVAYSPSIVKLYAQKDLRGMNQLVSDASRLSFLLVYALAVPLLVNMDLVLKIWLGTHVPAYAADFCRLIVVCLIIDATSGAFNFGIQATGRIRAYMCSLSLSFCFDLCLTYLLFRGGISPAWALLSRIFTRGVINMAIGLYFLHGRTAFSVKRYFGSVLFPVFLIIVITLPLPLMCHSWYGDTWMALFLSAGTFAGMAAGVYYMIGLKRNERVFLKQRLAVIFSHR